MKKKKNKLIIGLVMIATLFVAACSDSMETKTGDENQNPRVPKQITLSIAQPEATRVAYEYDAGILKGNWKEGDVVRVFGSSGYTNYTADADGTNGQPVTFTATGTDNAGNGPYNLFYPASRAADTYDACLINMLGQVQTAAQGSDHLAGFTVMTGTVNDVNNLNGTQLHHRTAVLRFDLTSAATDASKIRSITLSTQEKAEITTVEQAADKNTTEKSKQLTLAVQTSETNPLIAYMAVLPGTFTKNDPIGISVVYNDNTSTGVFYKTYIRENGEYKAGHVYNTKIATMTQADVFNNGTTATSATGYGTKDAPWIIASAGKLKWMIESVNQGSDIIDDYFKLTTDIWIDGNNGTNSIKWTPIGTNSSMFYGYFDGGGHTISGKLDAADGTTVFGFFGDVSYNPESSITNLHVAADVSGKNVPATSYTYYGGIAGKIEGQPFNQNCTYTGNINVTYTGTGTSSNHYVGGIFGNFDTNGTMERCQTVGNITTIASGNITIYSGGIAGSNSGDIHTSVAAVNFQGNASFKGQLVGVNFGNVYSCCWPTDNTAAIGINISVTTCPTHTVTP